MPLVIPELGRLAGEDKPFFLFLRHMDPHAPYLPPSPYDRMFYHGDECDRKNKSMRPVMAFKPFCDFFRSWMPPGITDKDWVIAQYDGAVAYMDSCLQSIFTQLETLGILDETIIVLNGDHGETLYDHECWFDHHGLYEPTLTVPLIIRYPRRVPAGLRVTGYNQHKDLVPTLLDLARIPRSVHGQKFDGQSLMRLIRGQGSRFDTEFYITECTWMRKHGWRTPHWKLIEALEPDFHFKPTTELYDLIEDPSENHNVADAHPDLISTLRQRMAEFIKQRERALGIKNPMLTQGDWHGCQGIGAFKTSRHAYSLIHIGGVAEGQKLQSRSRK